MSTPLGAPRHHGIAIDLDDLLAFSAAPPLSAALARARRAGGRRSAHKGRGMEFDEARPYVPGDDVRALDWKVTARSGHAHTKVFREERERPVFIAVDLRPAMFFATRGVYKSVQAARLAALIAWSAQQGGDRVGGQIMTAQAITEFKPRHGRHAVLTWLKQLCHAHALASHSAAVNAPSLTSALERLSLHARPGDLIYLISDFRGLDAASEHALGRLTRHCEVAPVLVYDDFESALPMTRGIVRLGDGQRSAVLDAAQAAQHTQRWQQRRQQLLSLARRYGLTVRECATHADPWTLFSARSSNHA